MAAGVLEVHLVEGEGLRNTDVFGKSDPYAIISYKDQEQKSSTVERGGSNPRWKQSFFFTVDEEVSEVKIKVFDEDNYSADDVVGTVTLPLAKVISEGEVPATSYAVLTPSGNQQGELKVGLKFTPKPSENHYHAPNTHHRPGSHHPDYSGTSEGPYGENSAGGWQQH